MKRELNSSKPGYTNHQHLSLLLYLRNHLTQTPGKQWVIRIRGMVKTNLLGQMTQLPKMPTEVTNSRIAHIQSRLQSPLPLPFPSTSLPFRFPCTRRRRRCCSALLQMWLTPGYTRIVSRYGPQHAAICKFVALELVGQIASIG